MLDWAVYNEVKNTIDIVKMEEYHTPDPPSSTKAANGLQHFRIDFCRTLEYSPDTTIRRLNQEGSMCCVEAF